MPGLWLAACPFLAFSGCLTNSPHKYGQKKSVKIPPAGPVGFFGAGPFLKAFAVTGVMRITLLSLLLLLVAAATPVRAELHITRDHGGYVEEYKAKYKRVRDKGERVIIDGICNSACTLVLGIVPMNKICVTPRASLGFHQAYYDKAFTFGIKVTSAAGTSDLMSYYPDTVKDWIRRNGGLTTDMKKIKNGVELWKIIDPCPEEW